MNLNIYFSDKCNLSCAYCHKKLSQDNNLAIRQAVTSGQFQQKIIDYLSTDIHTLTIIGLDPAANFDLFPSLIKPILAAHPHIKAIKFTTHGSRNLYHYFVEPLKNLPIELTIEFRIDGPAATHDFNHCKGAYEAARGALLNLIRQCPSAINSEFKLILRTSSILTKLNIVEGPAAWHTWSARFNEEVTKYAASKSYIDTEGIGSIPTLELPGRYFAKDMDRINQWDFVYPRVDTSLTIDYEGNLWDSPLLKNKVGMQEDLLRSNFDKRVDFLLKQKQIVDINNDRLFKAIKQVWRWDLAPDINTIEDSYIMLFGNL